MPKIATFTAHATDNTAEAVVEIHEEVVPHGRTIFVVKVPQVGTIEPHDSAMDTLRDALIFAAAHVHVAFNS